MKIIDINGKERNIKDDFKIVTDIRSNEVGKVFHENVDGELVKKTDMKVVDVEEKFVEVIIIGKNRQWVEWYPLEEFEKLNPGIGIN